MSDINRILGEQLVNRIETNLTIYIEILRPVGDVWYCDLVKRNFKKKLQYVIGGY